MGVGVYVCGAGAALGWSLRRALAAGAVVRRASPVSEARVLGAWGELSNRAELRRTARRSRLLESGALVSPACWGLVRPAVVVPEGFSRGRSDRTIRCALHHELIHVRRADHLVAGICAAAGAVLWAQPLLRRFGRALEEDRESSCDALVVRATGRAHEYAAALIECCSRGLALPVSMGSGAPLRRRILMLTHANVPAGRGRARFVTGLSGAAIATLLGVTGLLACAAAPASGGSGDRALIEVRAPAGERDPAKIVRLMQHDPDLGDRVEMTGTLAEQETIASGRAQKTADGLSMDELNLSLPEGSNLVARVSGDSVGMRPDKGGAVLILAHGEIRIADRKGVNRVTVSAADADATLVVQSKEENEEYNFVVSAVRKGAPSRVVIRWDDKTGRPEGEKSTPPGEFRFYTLDGRGANKDVWELKMQWCHDLSKVKVGGGAPPADLWWRRPEHTERSPRPLERAMKALQDQGAADERGPDAGLGRERPGRRNEARTQGQVGRVFFHLGGHWPVLG
jgi:BlaR1 peptidase M56